MIVAGTGHRPDKLGGYTQDNFERLVTIAEKGLRGLKATKVISGMALGWDQALAQAAINLSIPFIAAIPFTNQDKFWNEASQAYNKLLLSKAIEIVNVSGMDDYKVEYMQKRNEWMVDNCDVLLSMFDGSSGGTKNCVDYAIKKDKRMVNLFSTIQNNY